eukprot:EG_transcript_40868
MLWLQCASSSFGRILAIAFKSTTCSVTSLQRQVNAFSPHQDFFPETFAIPGGVKGPGKSKETKDFETGRVENFAIFETQHFPLCPEHFTSSPEHFPPSPENFTSSPKHFPSSPQHFTSSPKHFTSSPQHFTSSPQHFTSSPQHFTSSPKYKKTNWRIK